MNAKVAVHSSSRRAFVNQIRGLTDTISKADDIKINANRAPRAMQRDFRRFC